MFGAEMKRSEKCVKVCFSFTKRVITPKRKEPFIDIKGSTKNTI
jgi:hypothetical protein